MSMSTAAAPQRVAIDAAVRHLVQNYSPKGSRIGWLMMASILVEAWDLYSIAFVLIFIKEQYNPGALELGLAAAGTQGGALVGALIGGWLSDKIGRRWMFLGTMTMFVVLALVQAFVPNMTWLIVIRFLLGVPLGSDISTGYTYIMESMAKGEREVMGNRWQFMFAVGEVLTIGVIVIFLLMEINHETLWRVTLGLGAVPALIILLLRHDVPETAVWLVQRGRFKEAKAVARHMYNDDLKMLPDQDVVIPAPSTRAFIADLRKDPIRWRATVYGWIACFAQASEFSTFAFYLPVMFAMVGVSSLLGNNLVTMALFAFAAISGWVGPLLTPKIGHRGISIAGFGIVLVSLLIAAAALYTDHKYILPFAAAGMLWGHYWDASNCMTIPTMVARPQYRGTASGFAYMFVKLPSFLAIFLFPSLFAAIGQANATLFVAIFPLIGLLAAIFILPEVYGYEHD
ncbi:sugar porter family MFS transporter [Bradyrhizobium ontarionense]|uniref:Sugar porter family MFS transporter n=2 Tax=Bradyrhizobium ontarionense TaxID=2898149 RepID=A0ABY3RKC0_9BRAD|nr:MFS transporter [Bradyrhizobium sp. A19]UFZ07532.1 sugar porter family MFS transporter [Bradyrhizobium sp. A19]